MLVYQRVHEIGEKIIIHELGIPFSTSAKGRLLMASRKSQVAKANLARDHNDEVAAAAIRALGDFGKEGGRGQKWNVCSWDSPTNLGESRWDLLNLNGDSL